MGRTTVYPKCPARAGRAGQGFQEKALGGDGLLEVRRHEQDRADEQQRGAEIEAQLTGAGRVDDDAGQLPLLSSKALPCVICPGRAFCVRLPGAAARHGNRSAFLKHGRRT